MPWLWYLSDQADDILSYSGIPTMYKSSDELQFVAAKFNLEGHFLGYIRITSGEIQMCKNSRSLLDAAFKFGLRYTQQV